MSGRLIITGKKSYCPWRPENVERVLADERRERERLQREEERDSRARVEALKRRRKRDAERGHVREEVADGGEVEGEGGSFAAAEHERAAAPRHVNFFDREEKEAAQRAVEGALLGGQQRRRGGDDPASSGRGVMPVYLGGEEYRRRKAGREPFYLRGASASASVVRGAPGRTGRSGESAERKDATLKDSIDPMRTFVVASQSRPVGDDDAAREDGGAEAASEKAKDRPRIEGSSASASAAATESPEENTGRRYDERNPKRSRSRRGDRDEWRRSKHGRRKRRRGDAGSVSSSSSSSSSCTYHSSDSEESSSRGKRRDRCRSRRRRSKDRRRNRRDRRRGRGHRHSKEGRISDDACGSKFIGKGRGDRKNEGEISMDELRRRRAEREAREGAREAELIREERGKNAGRHREDRDRHYHNQYNPALSRM